MNTRLAMPTISWSETLVLVAAAAVIVLINWYFLFSGEAAGKDSSAGDWEPEQRTG